MRCKRTGCASGVEFRVGVGVCGYSERGRSGQYIYPYSERAPRPASRYTWCHTHTRAWSPPRRPRGENSLSTEALAGNPHLSPLSADGALTGHRAHRNARSLSSIQPPGLVSPESATLFVFFFLRFFGVRLTGASYRSVRTLSFFRQQHVKALQIRFKNGTGGRAPP